MAAENLIGGKPGELFTHRNLEPRNYSDINQCGYLFCCVTVWGGVELNSFVCCANLDGFCFTVFAVEWHMRIVASV